MGGQLQLLEQQNRTEQTRQSHEGGENESRITLATHLLSNGRMKISRIRRHLTNRPRPAGD